MVTDLDLSCAMEGGCMKILMMGGVAVFSMSAGGAYAQERCAAARSAAPALAVCVETPRGVVLGADAGEAQRLADLARAGEARFQTAFGRAPAIYAVMQGQVGPDGSRALRVAGFIVQLPWFTRDSFRQGLEDSTRRQVEAQAATHGLTPEQTRAVVDNALGQMRTRLSTGSLDRDPQAVPHELGHGWYTQAYWPGRAMDAQGHYGGPGPDWLDETAAIMMENESANQERRDQFRLAYSGRGLGTIDDLATFLHRDHPMKNANDLAREAARNGPGLVVMRSQEGGPAFEQVRQAGLFYAQGRVFADFMIQTSGQPMIFARIGAAFGEGKTIEQWLAAEGSSLRVGQSVADLDALWRAWLLSHYGAPVGTPAP